MCRVLKASDRHPFIKRFLQTHPVLTALMHLVIGLYVLFFVCQLSVQFAGKLGHYIRGSQGTEFPADSVVDSEFDSGPLRSPASSRSQFVLGPRIEIINSGVNSGLRIGSESISKSLQNQP
jgi:hypothetical protein